MKISRSTATLLLAGIGSALVYVVALLRFPLLEIYNIPLQNLDKLTQSNPTTGIVIVSAIILLFVAYALGGMALSRNDAKRAHWLVLLFPLLFTLLLLFVYPTTSLDVYDYLFRGRMLVEHGASPLRVVPAQFAEQLLALDARLQQQFNVKLLGVWPFGPQILFCKKPIAKLADVKGLKVRVYDQNLAKFIESVGGTPVPTNTPPSAWGPSTSPITTGDATGINPGIIIF